MSKIFYKFKSSKDYDTILFDGVSMSAFDLKREIMLGKKLGNGNNIDLRIYDAQTEDEFTQDHDQIPRNASIIVKKVPGSDFRNAARYLSGESNLPRGVHIAGATFTPSAPVTSSLPKTSVSSTAPIAISASEAVHKPVLTETITGLTEEDKIKALFETSNENWQVQSSALARSQTQKGLAYHQRAQMAASQQKPAVAAVSTSVTPGQVVGTMASGNVSATSTYGQPPGQIRPPPISYVCFKCGIGGHWIQFCPTIGGNKPTDSAVPYKKSTGIPNSFLQVIKGDTLDTINQDKLKEMGNLMVTSSGDLVLARVNDAEFKLHQERSTNLLSLEEIVERAREFESDGTVAPGTFLKSELLCKICGKFCHDAVVTTCCRSPFCDPCIRTQLQSQSNNNTNITSTTTSKCPVCQKFTSVEQIQIDKPTRALVGQAMRLIMEEIKKRQKVSSTDHEVITSQVIAPVSAFDTSKKFAIHIVDTTDERIIKRKFDDRGWETVYDVLAQCYVPVKQFDLPGYGNTSQYKYRKGNNNNTINSQENKYQSRNERYDDFEDDNRENYERDHQSYYNDDSRRGSLNNTTSDYRNNDIENYKDRYNDKKHTTSSRGASPERRRRDSSQDYHRSSSRRYSPHSSSYSRLRDRSKSPNDYRRRSRSHSRGERNKYSREEDYKSERSRENRNNRVDDNDYTRRHSRQRDESRDYSRKRSRSRENKRSENRSTDYVRKRNDYERRERSRSRDSSKRYRYANERTSDYQRPSRR